MSCERVRSGYHDVLWCAQYHHRLDPFGIKDLLPHSNISNRMKQLLLSTQFKPTKNWQEAIGLIQKSNMKSRQSSIVFAPLAKLRYNQMGKIPSAQAKETRPKQIKEDISCFHILIQSSLNRALITHSKIRRQVHGISAMALETAYHLYRKHSKLLRFSQRLLPCSPWISSTLVQKRLRV